MGTPLASVKILKLRGSANEFYNHSSYIAGSSMCIRSWLDLFGSNVNPRAIPAHGLPAGAWEMAMFAC
jgi:hypothetical protein